ncbi:MAG: FtsH protease activity modulator HflK [Burkholderiaceae bacterium]
MPENTHSSRCASWRAALRKALVPGLRAQGQDGGPPDLDELWRDFTTKLARFFGLGNRKGDAGGGGNGGGFQADPRSTGMGIAAILLIVVVVWLFSGSFIVQEGQRAVVTTFGRYSHTVGAGWGWRWPWPIQDNETINFTQLRTVEVGGNGVSSATGLHDSAMLTQDENIVDVRFNVQYSLKDARDFLFNNDHPDTAVQQAAESAVREIVGRSRIDSILYEQREALPQALAKSIQAQLDRLNAGVFVAKVNIENVTVPEQVTQAFQDVIKAGVDRDRLKNEGQAYANQVIASAKGDAARLHEDALGYKARIVGAAEGDSDRFKAILAEYQKAPAVTRDRMYIDAMTEVYANVAKVMVDTHGGTNLIQLPLDKLAQASAANGASSSSGGGSGASASPTPSVTVTPVDPSSPSAIDSRARDASRARDRDTR